MRIVDHVELLTDEPKLGRPGRVPGTRELVVPRTPYIVAYAVLSSDSIRILGVRHGARRWPESF
jgi:plasmid stabilization system protein ParE